MASAILDKAKIATTEGNITVYNFSAQTGEYTGSSEAYLAIGVGLPASATRSRDSGCANASPTTHRHSNALHQRDSTEVTGGQHAE